MLCPRCGNKMFVGNLNKNSSTNKKDKALNDALMNNFKTGFSQTNKKREFNAAWCPRCDNLIVLK